MKATLFIEAPPHENYQWQICPNGNLHWFIDSDPVYKSRENARRAARKVARRFNIQLHEAR